MSARFPCVLHSRDRLNFLLYNCTGTCGYGAGVLMAIAGCGGGSELSDELSQWKDV